MSADRSNEFADRIITQTLPRLAVIRQMTLLLAARWCAESVDPQGERGRLVADLRASIDAARLPPAAARAFCETAYEEIDALERQLRQMTDGRRQA